MSLLILFTYLISTTKFTSVRTQNLRDCRNPRGANETAEFNHNAYRIRFLFSREHRIESTKCAPLLAFIIGLYRIFYLRDPNEILMKHVVPFSPIRVFCRKRTQLRYYLSFKGYIWLVHPPPPLKRSTNQSVDIFVFVQLLVSRCVVRTLILSVTDY